MHLSRIPSSPPFNVQDDHPWELYPCSPFPFLSSSRIKKKKRKINFRFVQAIESISIILGLLFVASRLDRKKKKKEKKKYEFLIRPSKKKIANCAHFCRIAGDWMEIESLDAMIDLEEVGLPPRGKWVYEKFIGTAGALTWSNVVSSKLCRYLTPLPALLPGVEYHNWTVDDF